MLKDNFIKAIEKLKRRNQALVDKNGVTGYTQETDRILSDLVDYFNDREKQVRGIEAANETINKLILILKLYGIPYHELFALPVEFLEMELKKKSIQGDLPNQPFIYLFEILNDYNKHQVIIESYLQVVSNFRKIKIKAIQDYCLENYPFLAEYFYCQDPKIIVGNLTRVYYAGSIDN